MAARPQLAIVNYRKGMYITLEGNRDADRFFIIQSGRVQVSMHGEVVMQENGAALGPGDFFGVVSSMSLHSEVETVQALTDVSLVAVSRGQFEGLLSSNTPIALKIIQQFSRRMRYLNNELTHLTLQSESVAEGSEVLYKAASRYTKQKNNVLAAYAYNQYVQYYPNGAYTEEAKEQLVALKDFNKANFRSGDSPFIQHYPKDSPIFIEGEPGESLFIIQSGSVKITKVINDDEVILSILKPGDIFGEMAILESKPRSASAIAFESTSLMYVLKKNFEAMAAKQPQIISRLTQLLADRIWFSYKQLENAAIKDPVGRCYDYLLIHLERSKFNIQHMASYEYNFGLEDLVKMASVPENEVKPVIKQLLSNPKIYTSGDNKICVSDTLELCKLSDYYKNMQKRISIKK
jgi:CRP-like cAMP-binding protein